MDEALIVASILSDRKYYDEAMRIGLDSGDFSEIASGVLKAVMDQYRRDPALLRGDNSLLLAQVERKYGKKSELTRAIIEFIQSLPPNTSGVNILDEYRLVRLRRVSTELATLLAMGKHGDETDKVLEQYLSMRDESGGQGRKWRLGADDFTDASGERLFLAPRVLNEFIGGGVLRGHNITVYGRPESGKSMFSLNQAAAALRQGRRVLYVANEEPARDITTRLLARLTNTTIDKLRRPETMAEAIERAAPAYNNWCLLHRAGAGLADVRAAARDTNPDWIIVDQLKNLRAKDDNRALQLDSLARGVRELGGEFDAATLSVTQAGESAEGKKVLRMNDIEWSNTGIPGAADLLIGIGVDAELDTQGKRMLSLPKNKINGKHGHLPVFVDPMRTAFLTSRKI